MQTLEGFLARVRAFLLDGRLQDLRHGPEREEYPITYQNCIPVAMFLERLLQERDPRWQAVAGYAEQEWHAFVWHTASGLMVDITADQFGLDEVLVGVGLSTHTISKPLEQVLAIDQGDHQQVQAWCKTWSEREGSLHESLLFE